MPKITATQLSFWVDLNYLFAADTGHVVTGKMAIILPKIDSIAPEIGDSFYFQFSPQTLPPPNILSNFDYAKYLNSYQISHQQKIDGLFYIKKNKDLSFLHQIKKILSLIFFISISCKSLKFL